MARHPDAPRPPVAAALAVIAAGLLLAGCGVSAEDVPREIAQDLTTTSTTSEVEAGTDTAQVELWFTEYSEDDDRFMLVPVSTDVVVDDSGEPTPGVVLETLFEGVPAGFDDRDLGSRIPTETTLSGPPDEPVGGVLTIDLESGIELQGSGSRLAFGQMVCSVVELDAVEAVTFTRQGEPLDPVDGSGEARTDPLTCADYAQRTLLAPPDSDG